MMPTLTPSNADQLQLLELQNIDTTLGNLRHQRQTDPSISAVTTLERKQTTLAKALAAAKTHTSDLQREVSKVQAFIDEANTRIVNNQKKIDKGDLNHKDTLAVSEEMTTLVTRIATLEDQQLEVMERHEGALTAENNAAAAYQQATSDLAAAEVNRDKTLADITDQGRATIVQRDAAAKTINPALVAQYDKLRAKLGGIGAARYWGGRCEGCGLELPPSEKEKVAQASPDQVITCEECGRILVRVPQ